MIVLTQHEDKDPGEGLVFWLIIGFIIICILSSLDSHAKPKPKYKDYPLPIIIQSKPSSLPINEGEYLKLVKIKKLVS